MNRPKDEGLNGNEKIEQAVYALQQEATQEQLAHTLTVIRRRMKEHGQFVVAVEPNLGSEQMQLRTIRTADGASWWYARCWFCWCCGAAMRLAGGPTAGIA